VRLGLVTEGLIHRSLDGVMDWLDERAPEIRDLEVATGGYSPPGHSPLGLSQQERRAWHAHIRSRGFEVVALNVSGNPLSPVAAVGRQHDQDLRAAIEAAAELAIPRVVAMSGTPAAGPGTSPAPHFAANAWLPDYRDIAEWQWEQRVRPYWEGIGDVLQRLDASPMVCLELHPGAYVFNVDTFLRLNAAVPAIGVNVDPSHLFWQGMDPLVVVERLGRKIGHAHAKDVRYHPAELALNGLLDNRWPGDPTTIGWDFAAVGQGVHDAAWWAAFAEALAAYTAATVFSIEHEDRLVGPEDGIPSSVELLAPRLPASTIEAPVG
jgi:sugar phosphate isomerase/epimerase